MTTHVLSKNAYAVVSEAGGLVKVRKADRGEEILLTRAEVRKLYDLLIGE